MASLPSYSKNSYINASFLSPSKNFNEAILDKLKYDKQIYYLKQENVHLAIESKDTFHWMGYIFIPHGYITKLCSEYNKKLVFPKTEVEVFCALNDAFSVPLKKHNIEFNFYAKKSIANAVGFYPTGYNLLRESIEGKSEPIKEYYSFRKMLEILGDISDVMINKFPELKEEKVSNDDVIQSLADKVKRAYSSDPEARSEFLRCFKEIMGNLSNVNKDNFLSFLEKFDRPKENINGKSKEDVMVQLVVNRLNEEYSSDPEGRNEFLKAFKKIIENLNDENKDIYLNFLEKFDKPKAPTNNIVDESIDPNYTIDSKGIINVADSGKSKENTFDVYSDLLEKFNKSKEKTLIDVADSDKSKEKTFIDPKATITDIADSD